MADSGDWDFRAWLHENREWVKREAESDAPDAWVFQRILVFLDNDLEAADA